MSELTPEWVRERHLPSIRGYALDCGVNGEHIALLSRKSDQSADAAIAGQEMDHAA